MGAPAVIPPCYEINVLNPSRIWQTGNVLQTELPVIAIQIVFVVIISRLLFFVYKPLHQTRIISQISVSISINISLYKNMFICLFVLFFNNVRVLQM